MIHQHYDPQQIIWFLRNFWKYTREDLIQLWNSQYEDTDFGKSQYQWLKSRYGMKGEWGAVLNTPPYPGARPGGPGTETFVPANIPTQPPRVTLRTQSSSPAPKLAPGQAQASTEAMPAAFNPAAGRARVTSRGAQAAPRPNTGPSGYHIAQSAPATMASSMKTTAPAANTQGAYMAASSGNVIGGNNASGGSTGISSYHFPYPLTSSFVAPSSMAMPMSAMTTSNPTSGIFGQSALSGIQTQPLRYGSLGSSLPYPLAASTQPFMHLGSALDSDDAFSLGNVSSGYGLGGGHSQFTALAPPFAPAPSVPSAAYAGMAATGSWMPETMYGGAPAPVSGTGQMMGPRAAAGQHMSMEMGMEEGDGQTGAVRFSPARRTGSANKRKRRGVSVDVEQPQSKRIVLNPTARISAAADLVAAKVDAPRSSSISSSISSSVSSSATSGSSSNMTAAVATALGAAGTTAPDRAMSPRGDHWFDGLHAGCSLNARHMHYASGGVFFASDNDCMAAMRQATATASSPSEGAVTATATNSSPVVSSADEDETDAVMLARLLGSGDGQTDGQSVEEYNTQDHVTVSVAGNTPQHVQHVQQAQQAQQAEQVAGQAAPGMTTDSSFATFDSFDPTALFAEHCAGPWDMEATAAVDLDAALESALSALSEACEPSGLVAPSTAAGPQSDTESLIDKILFGSDNASGPTFTANVGCSSGGHLDSGNNMDSSVAADGEPIDLAQ